MYDICLHSTVLISAPTPFPGSFRLGFLECELLKDTLHVNETVCPVSLIP